MRKYPRVSATSGQRLDPVVRFILRCRKPSRRTRRTLPSYQIAVKSEEYCASKPQASELDRAAAESISRQRGGPNGAGLGSQLRWNDRDRKIVTICSPQ